MIEKKNGMGSLGEGVDDGVGANIVGDGTLDVGDEAGVDWSGFDLDPELWQYV